MRLHLYILELYQFSFTDCPKRTISRWRCVGNKQYKRVIVYYKLFQGTCIRQKRVETRRITTCRRRVWYTYRCIKHGIRLVFRHYRRLIRCRCIVTKTLVKKGRCSKYMLLAICHRPISHHVLPVLYFSNRLSLFE